MLLLRLQKVGNISSSLTKHIRSLELQDTQHKRACVSAKLVERDRDLENPSLRWQFDEFIELSLRRCGVRGIELATRGLPNIDRLTPGSIGHANQPLRVVDVHLILRIRLMNSRVLR